MEVELVGSYPYRALEPDLERLMQGARRVEAAVASVTGCGVDLLRRHLRTHPPRGDRLVASVRFPTNLPELARLEDEFPGTVRLHLGFKTPEEAGADRGQLHSKVVLIEVDQTQRCIVLGSHDWTQNALQGYSLEAGVVLRARESEPIVAEVREHIEACARRSEPLARGRLRFYEAVQRDLERGVGPGSQQSETFPGFEPIDALVIHAEDATPGGLPEPVQLFIPVRDGFLQQLFAETRRVLLYVYPAGTLIRQSPPAAAPHEYEGTVTMRNVVTDSPVTARAATCRIDDLAAPRIELLPEGVVPHPNGETYQVVIRLDRKRTGELPVFHTAQRRPTMQLGVHYQTIDRDEGDERVRYVRRDREGADPIRPPSPLPEYRAPHHLTVRSLLRVPGQDLYRNDIGELLTCVLTGAEFFDDSMAPNLKLETPAADRVLNRYVYRVNFRLSEETMAQIEKQLKLPGVTR